MSKALSEEFMNPLNLFPDTIVKEYSQLSFQICSMIKGRLQLAYLLGYISSSAFLSNF
jgi:hypothetical protein